MVENCHLKGCTGPPWTGHPPRSGIVTFLWLFHFFSYFHLWAKLALYMTHLSSSFNVQLSAVPVSHHLLLVPTPLEHTTSKSGTCSHTFKMTIQWGTKLFKWFLKLDCFLNNSRTTLPGPSCLAPYFVIPMSLLSSVSHQPLCHCFLVLSA